MSGRTWLKEKVRCADDGEEEARIQQGVEAKERCLGCDFGAADASN
jgi:hypothetical protein